MAKYCYDQYDHPLLWCNQKRRSEERKIAVEGLAVAQYRREAQENARASEEREVRSG